jgi:hypothetical protein
MKLRQLLEERSEIIIDRASSGIRGTGLEPHAKTSQRKVRAHLVDLYRFMRECIDKRDLGPVISHAERIAVEQVRSGFSLCEIQATFNALEEAVWLEIVGYNESIELQEALSMVSAAIGIGKDAFARAYIELASAAKPPSTNVNR